jgi:hypothetical protein
MLLTPELIDQSGKLNVGDEEGAKVSRQINLAFLPHLAPTLYRFRTIRVKLRADVNLAACYLLLEA